MMERSVAMMMRTAGLMLLMCGPLLAQMHVSVEGRGIDIRSLEVGTPLYPTGSSPKFPAYRNSPHMITVVSGDLASKEYATIPVIPDDKRTDYGLTRVKGDRAGDLMIGVANPKYEREGWTRTPGVFKTRTKTYYRYRHKYPTPDTWVSLPQAAADTGGLPVIVYGEEGHIKFGNPLPVPGTVIVSETDYPGAQAVFNVSMIVMPDGDYMANCTMRGRCPTFRSTDQGRTWKLVSDRGLPLSFQSLFAHQGRLYLLGKAFRDRNAPVDGRTAVLYESTDSGVTWSDAVYLPFEIAGGHGHDSGPSRMLKCGDRLIRAVQVQTDGRWGPGFISVDAKADLRDPRSWSVANGVVPSSRWHPFEGATLKVMDEGDTLLSRDGAILNMAKTQYRVDPKKPRLPAAGAAMVTHVSPNEAVFNPATDFIHLPGGGSKFSVRYDRVSDKYWALTSMGRNRSELHLFSSRNLRSFVFERKVLVGRSDYFDGHNYPFMHIDGDDIVFVLRHAHENERGQPQRWHDANHMTFHRIEGFRKASATTRP